MVVRRRKRSKFKSALAGAIGGFAEGATAGLRRQAVLEDEARRADTITRRQLDADVLNQDQALEAAVAEGKIMPEQAREMAENSRRSTGSRAPIPDFMGAQAPLAQRVAPVRRKIEEATSPAMVPTEEGIYEDIAAQTREIPPVPGAGEAAAFSPTMQTAMGVRRQKLKGFEDDDERKIATAGRQAGTVATATGVVQEDLAAKNAPAVLGRKVAEEEAVGGVRGKQAVDTAVKTQAAVGPMRTTEAINTARGSAEARLDVEFSPKFVAARIAEATQKAAADLKLAGDKESQKLVVEANNAAGKVTPLLQDLATISARINTREGSSARSAGAVRTAKGALGLDADVRLMNQKISQLIRPMAQAMGVREANISDFDQRLVERGITLTAFSTATERRQSLRSMRDLVSMAPIVAATPGDAGTKADHVAGLILARQRAEDAAISAGATSFIDPATNAIIPVIR